MYYLAVSGATVMTSSSSTYDSRLTSCDGVRYTEKTGQGDETRLPPGFDIIYPVITKREQISRIYTFNNNTRVSTKHQTLQLHPCIPNTLHSNLFKTHFYHCPTIIGCVCQMMRWYRYVVVLLIYLSPRRNYLEKNPVHNGGKFN